jgi:ketosteroid isomerase-like protein
MEQHGSNEVLTLSRQKWEWMSNQDTTSLATLIHDDAVFVHMGATFTKAQELDVIATGAIHYRDIDISDVSIRLIGDTAIVLTTLQLGAVVGGDLVTNPFVVTEVYVLDHDGWELASLSFTRLITRP